MPRLEAYGLLDCDDESVEISNLPSDQFKHRDRPQQEEQANEENANHSSLAKVYEHGSVRSEFNEESYNHHRSGSDFSRKRGSASNRLTRMFRKDSDEKGEHESNSSMVEKSSLRSQKPTPSTKVNVIGRGGTSTKQRNSPCRNRSAEQEISISWHRNNSIGHVEQRNQQMKKEPASINRCGDDIVERRSRMCHSINTNTRRQRTRSRSSSRRRGVTRTKRRTNSAGNIRILSTPTKNKDVVEIYCDNSITSEATLQISNSNNSPKEIGCLKLKNNSLDSENVNQVKNETDDHTQQCKIISTKQSSRLREKERSRQRSRSRSKRESRTRQPGDRSKTDRRRRMIDRQGCTVEAGGDEKNIDEDAKQETGGSAKDRSPSVSRRKPPVRNAPGRSVSHSNRVDGNALCEIAKRLEKQKQSEESKRETTGSKSRIRGRRRSTTTRTRNRSTSVNSRKRRNRNKTSSRRSSHIRNDNSCSTEFFWKREPSSRILIGDKEAIAT